MRPFIVTGLGYGDEGKGTIVDALVRRYGLSLVVRHNGGAQAAHNVWTEDGRHHTFSQFGSGTFVVGVKTLLSRFMLVNPGAMLNENQHLCTVGVVDAFSRTVIDCRARITTPWHITLNRLKEAERGAARHGSCGMGIGETVADSLDRPDSALLAGDLLKPDLHDKLTQTQQALCCKYPRFSETLKQNTVNSAVTRMLEFASVASIVSPKETCRLIEGHACVFEGAQGTLLDEDFGFHPHTTWSKTTDANALLLLQEAEVLARPVKFGVTRWYLTRHGDGPFRSEDVALNYLIADDDNETGEFQGVFRVGAMDIPLLRYAIKANSSVDYLAVTHLDKLTEAEAETTLNKLEFNSDIPVGVASRGKTASRKHFYSYEMSC